MYKEFYGLRDYPFNITPDPRYLVFTHQYKELLARLHFSIDMAKGLTVLVGETGTGKTTALRWILRQMETTVLPVYIFNPCISIDEFYHQLDSSLNIGDWSNKTALLMKMGKLLENRHSLGLRTVLIIDEAHQLSDRLLEEIRLLMNFESDNAKHLQIILSGQPELTDKLNQPDLRQLKQRVTLNCRLKPLESVREVEDYINERLILAGSVLPGIFATDAVELIFQCSAGIPRQINNLCDHAMLTAYESNIWLIGRDIVADVAIGLGLLREKDPVPVVKMGLEINTEKRFLSSAGIEQLLSEFDSKWRGPSISDMPDGFQSSEDKF